MATAITFQADKYVPMYFKDLPEAPTSLPMDSDYAMTRQEKVSHDSVMDETYA
jgi:hypothetical protein